ncbi:hypothetical protein AAG570_006286 [Ranatra chinensis]|uniref:Palmitoyltransferase n=1 Tax=Ranatra chinensis TaxID=642074 RepID=A0ABD0YTU8_9HEMI
MSTPLCCCEYIDLNNERNHILGCCCNCVELDLCFDRLITCRPLSDSLTRAMATANDRLRFPWRGGAKHFTIDAVVPIFLLPILIFTAAQGVWISVVVFTFLPLFLMYLHFISMSCNPQSVFFFAWTIMSVVTVFVIFEFIGVRMLEIRDDENIIFTFLTVSILFCLHKVKQKSYLSLVNIINELPTDNSLGKMNVLCTVCDMKVPARAFHCHICNACILKRDQHCIWLNCCIGQNNHRWYLLLLFASISQLVFCSNLILTTACHPFKVWGTIMLPDDCSDVYFDSMYAVCFVTALYCLEGSLFLASLLIHELWLISLGMTGHEWRNRGKWSRCCGFFSSRPYSKGFLQNWLRYCKGNSKFMCSVC